MERLRTFMKWYLQTSCLVGIPVVFLLLVMGFEKFFFTATCTLASYRCEYAIGATDAMAEYMGDLLASNSERDLVSVPRDRKR